MDVASDDLNPEIKRTGLTEEVKRNRALHAQYNERERPYYEPRIQVHTAAHRAGIAAVERPLQALADELDFDLTGDSRPAALWQMSSRCIGIMRLMLDALDMGYTEEPVFLARELHEASGLIDVFVDPDEADLLRKWLADENAVMPKAVHAAIKRSNEKLAVKLPHVPVEKMSELGKLIYAVQSEAAHHRRRFTQDSISVPLRMSLRGPHNLWARRAEMTNEMLPAVEGGLLHVADALCCFYDDFASKHLQPHLDTFAALRLSHPLPPDD